MMHETRWMGTALAMVWILLGGAAASAQDVIKIGAFGPMTGGAAATDRASMRPSIWWWTR